jgi:hypothetical protein
MGITRSNYTPRSATRTHRQPPSETRPRPCWAPTRATTTPASSPRAWGFGCSSRHRRWSPSSQDAAGLLPATRSIKRAPRLSPPGRWRNHAARGDGGAKLLRERDSKNFAFQHSPISKSHRGARRSAEVGSFVETTTSYAGTTRTERELGGVEWPRVPGGSAARQQPPQRQPRLGMRPTAGGS